MPPKKLFPAVLCALALLGPGCSDDGDDGAAASDELTATTFVERLGSEFRRLYACFTADYLLDLELSEFQASADALKAEHDAGRLTFGKAEAQRCLDALAAIATCDDLYGAAGDAFDEKADDCALAFAPDVDLGGACYEAVDSCKGGFCDFATAETCPGTCVAYSGEGGTCAADDADGVDPFLCDPALELFCDGATKSCLARKVVDESCAADAECQRALSCDPQTLTCRARGDRGTECASSAGCRDGLWCVDARCEPPAAKGERCDERPCAAGLFCDPPATAEGAADDALWTCADFLSEGASCRAAAACGALSCAGLALDLDTGALTPGTCRAYADVDQACVAAPDGDASITGCKDGLSCDAGVCRIPPASGACAPGSGEALRCDPRAGVYCDGDGQCVPKKAEGASCSSDWECQSDFCESSDGSESRTCAADPWAVTCAPKT